MFYLQGVNNRRLHCTSIMPKAALFSRGFSRVLLAVGSAPSHAVAPDGRSRWLFNARTATVPHEMRKEKVTKKESTEPYTIPIQIQLVCLLKVLFLSIKSYLFLDLQFLQLIF